MIRKNGPTVSKTESKSGGFPGPPDLPVWGPWQLVTAAQWRPGVEAAVQSGEREDVINVKSNNLEQRSRAYMHLLSMNIVR